MNKDNEKSLLVVVIIVALLSAPFIFITGMMVGLEIEDFGIFTSESLPSWVAAFATVAIAVLTFILAKETWYLREAQIRQVEQIRRESIRPLIGLELRRSQVSYNLMDVVITNHGKGFAKAIEFQFVDKDNKRILETEDPIVDVFYKLNIFKKGIAILGIKQSKTSYLINFMELHDKCDDVFDNYFKVNLSYEDNESFKYNDCITFDFSEYKGMSEVGDSNPLYTISKEIEKISKKFNSITSPSNKLHVNTYNTKDRNKIKFEQDNRRKEYIEKGNSK